MLYEIVSSGCSMKSTTVGDSEFRFRLSQVLANFSSVAALARELGVSDNAIYKWLAGRGQPSVSNLVSLSRTAGVSLEWLATGRESGGAVNDAARSRESAARGGVANDAAPPKAKSAAGAAATGVRRSAGSAPLDARVTDVRDGGNSSRAKRGGPAGAVIRRTRSGPSRARESSAADARAHESSAADARARHGAAAHPRARNRARAALDAVGGAPADAGGGGAARPAAGTYDQYTFPPYQRARVRNGADGLIRSEQVVDSLAFKTEWLRRRLAAAPRNLMLVEVVGDAMAPTLGDSDLILVDLSEPRFQQDGVYVLRRDGELEVKRLQRGPSGTVIIKSDNSAYESTVVSRDRVGIIGRVIWAAGRI
jgi:phage repressor protein C with HTH and peptisase S24 domain